MILILFISTRLCGFNYEVYWIHIYSLAPSIDEVINDANEIGFDDAIINRLRGITTEIQTLAAVWAMDQVIPLRHLTRECSSSHMETCLQTVKKKL